MTSGLDDCPLPLATQRRNMICFAVFWSIIYLCAPVTYIGLTHANLLKALGNNDKISNLPSAVYQWLTIVPVVVAWLLPHPRFLKRLALTSIGIMSATTACVAVALGWGVSPTLATIVVVGHAASFSAANGVLLTALWDALKRGVSTSRRGPALGFAFGAGPLLACVGAVLQDATFEGKLLGGHSFGLEFPTNYLAMFAAAAPTLLIAALVIALFQLPDPGPLTPGPTRPLAEVQAGFRQFAGNRPAWLAIVIYVIVYSGGNSIFANVSLHAKTVLGSDTDTLGIQSFLRFGCKAIAGGLLGWLLARSSARATLVATTSILLVGMAWALSTTGWLFMATFGLLGAGELFGAYFPNYVTTASQKKLVRINMAYLSVLGTLIGFSSLAFGAISDRFGRIASFVVASGLLVCALALISLLPANPAPGQED